MENFTFISPIPYPITEVSKDAEIIGPLSSHECVEFFWRVKRVTLNATLNTYVKEIDSDLPIWDEEKKINLNSQEFDCAFAVSMPERALKNTPCRMYNDLASFDIHGPFLDEEYPQETSFINRKYVYTFNFYFGLGNITMESRFFPDNGYNGTDYLITAQQFPFEVFGKKYYLNLNVPYSMVYPENFGIEARFSGNANLNFEFLEDQYFNEESSKPAQA